jgi:hypothetical protein
MAASDVADRAKAQIAEACSDVDLMYRPRPMQWIVWKDLVEWPDGVDPDGFFLGTCAISKADGEVHHLASYNFHKGVMRCDSCEPGGSVTMSLNRIIESIAIKCLRTTPVDE